MSARGLSVRGVSSKGRSASRGWGWVSRVGKTPPALWDTVNKRAVRILLKCILFILSIIFLIHVLIISKNLVDITCSQLVPGCHQTHAV